MKALRADERDMLAAYTAGANAGLAALGAPPFEYLALRSEPAKWRDEDSLLCALAMYRDLQGRQPWQESLLGLMRETLPPALSAFLAPVGTEWDAPIEGDRIPMPAVPGPDVVDLRRAQPEEAVARSLPPSEPGALAFLGVPLGPGLAGDDDRVRGSNNWAVAGTHTVHGGALLANDMHLGISVPNTWYRVSLVFPGADGERRVTGVTLPGAPFVVAGSNGHVAWGFTNSEGDWADLVLLEPDPGNPDAYRTPAGPRTLERETETIEVKGEKAETLAVESTIWGPVIDKDFAGRRRALAWVALREGGLNASLVRMESVGSLDEAQALAPEAGMPNQNFVVADSAGHIGWTIIGRIPRRVGHDGSVPTSWADGTRRWDGWLAPADYPRVVDPPSGRIWTANARVVGGEKLAKVGVGGYDLGARQGQIRDDLLAIDKASESDMLRVQLDDRALFLARWQRLALATLTPDATASDPRRAEARRLVETLGRARRDRLGGLPDRAGLPRAGEGPRPRPAPGPRAREGPEAPPRHGAELEVGGAGVGTRDRASRAPPRPPPGQLGRAASRGARRRPRGADRERSPARGAHVGRAQHDAHPPPALPRRAPARGLPGHAAGAAARRQPHAAVPVSLGGGVRALRRLARAGGAGLLPHAVRAERAPALAALRGRPRGLGQGREDALPAGAGRAGADARPGPLTARLAERRTTMARRVTVLAAAALAASLAGAAPAPEKAGLADRIFVNGRVWTGEPGRPLVEALAVRGTTVLAVGTSTEMRTHSGKGTDIVDLRGRFVAPGFIDGHLHLLGGSVSLEELRLDDAETFRRSRSGSGTGRPRTPTRTG